MSLGSVCRMVAMAAIGAAVLSSCSSTASPLAAVKPVTVTRTVTTTATVTATATITQMVTATVTAPPQFVQVPPPGPIDVTDEYRAWRQKHFDPQYSDAASQYQEVAQATLDGTRLDVLASYNLGGWDCVGEPTSIAGHQVRYARILNADSSVFRVCSIS